MMVCALKKLHVNVTINLQSLLYLCLVISGCIKHNKNSGPRLAVALLSNYCYLPGLGALQVHQCRCIRVGIDGRRRMSGTWGWDRRGRSQQESGGGSGRDKVRMSGASRWERHGLVKVFLLVGYVLVYGMFYRRRSRSQSGGGTSDPFPEVQYLECPERGN